MALKARVEVVSLDTARDYTGAPIWAVQGERQSLVLQLDVTCQGEAIDYADTHVVLKYRRADGYSDTILLNESSESLETLIALLPACVFTNAGEVVMDVTIMDNVNNITIKTPTFKLFVLESI